MAQDIDRRIIRDAEEDTTLHVKGLGVEIGKKSLFGRRKLLRIKGTVANEHEREKLMHIAEYHAGDAYDIVNELKVTGPQKSEV
jgi:hypothetical protein